MNQASDGFRWSFLRLPKEGNSEDEYEDSVSVNAKLGRFAIADGASESIFAGEWSRLLTESFVSQKIDKLDWPTWLPPLRSEWLQSVTKGVTSWYAQEKIDVGAFATFLGLELTDKLDHGQKWRAVAVGDSCLFQIRDGQLLCSFPIHESSEFSTRPPLIGSQPQSSNPAVKERTAIGMLKPGDLLFLTTDALGQWFLQECESGAQPWEMLTQMEAEIFSLWIDEQRKQKRLKNDDVTMLLLEYQGG
jgi:hypothetical protein